MPRHGMVIAGLVLLCVLAAAADQLLHWSSKSTRPLSDARAAGSVVPVSDFGPAMAAGAQHRLDRLPPPE